MFSLLSSFFRFICSLFHWTPRQPEIRHSIWQPTETWVDVFEFLPRRDLVRSVQPTCRRFHAIAELHVRNVHILRHLRQFLDGLEPDLPEQLTDLRDPGEYFRLDGRLTFYVEGHTKHNPRRSDAQKCLLRHSLDLFLGCQLILLPFPSTNRTDFLAYLAMLKPVRPCYIYIEFGHGTAEPELQVDELLREPIVLSCPRVMFNEDMRNRSKPSAASICNWLHHLPTCEDDEKKHAIGTRIIDMGSLMLPSTPAEIIECCKKLLLQSESPSDRHTFLLIFCADTQQEPFRLEHPPTGEVLHLEEIHLSEFPGKSDYHLRRCPIADLATADQFYRDNFEKEIFFRTPVKSDGLEPPTLIIR